MQQVSMSKKESRMMPTWAFPLFGLIVMFSLAAFVGARAHTQRSTHQVLLLEASSDEEAFLNE